MNCIKKCKHIECDKDIYLQFEYCEFHYNGGVFGNGETYSQYQIIEQDFINFIRIVPINHHNNSKVYSPNLRDIILRTCIQIEIFLKEWGKYECSEDTSIELFKKYFEKNKKSGAIKGAKNWKFGDYYFMKEKYIQSRKIYVRDIDKEIEPFQSWKNSNEVIPDWWNVYNSIKHDGINSIDKINLDITLNSLAALYLLNCSNYYSLTYLRQFSNTEIKKDYQKIRMKFNQITSPIDSKKYLFKDTFNSESFETDIQQDRPKIRT